MLKTNLFELLVISSIGSDDLMILGVENVKIQENSEKIRGPPGDL